MSIDDRDILFIIFILFLFKSHTVRAYTVSELEVLKYISIKYISNRESFSVKLFT